jgi:hypothetical protein
MDNILNQILFNNQNQKIPQYRIFHDDDTDQEEAAKKGLTTPQAPDNPFNGLAAPGVPGFPGAAGFPPGMCPCEMFNGAPATPVAQGDTDKAAAVIADALLAKGGGSMKTSDVVARLGEKGIQSRETKIDGRNAVEILDKNGNVVNKLRDTDGNGTIGIEDKEFVAELERIGYDNNKIGALKAKRDQKKAEKDAGKVAGLQALNGLNPANQVNKAEETDKVADILGVGGENKTVNQDLLGIQMQLYAAGFYEKTAEQLVNEGTLAEVAGRLGIHLSDKVA